MAFSSSTNFFHFPISISPTNSNSNIYNSVSLYTTSNRQPPATTAKRRGYLCVKCNRGTELKKDDDDSDNDNDATLKRVHKLFEVIKNKNMSQLSEVLADELPDAYNSIPFLRIFRAKLQVLEFFSHLFKSLGNSLQFTVKPTTKNGSMMGVKWKLGWGKTLMTLGKGVHIHSHHTYAGKLLIGNLETIIDHFLHQPKPMRLMDLDLNLVPKQRREASLCLGFFLLALSLFFFQFSVR